MNEAEAVHEVSTQEGYARWAFTYDGETNALIILEEAHASSILDSLSFTNTLDVGAGTGRYALKLARRGVRVTALDQASEMLEQRQGHVSRHGPRAGRAGAPDHADTLGYYVADSGPYSTANMIRLNRAGVWWVSRVPETLAPAQEAVRRQEVTGQTSANISPSESSQIIGLLNGWSNQGWVALPLTRPGTPDRDARSCMRCARGKSEGWQKRISLGRVHSSPACLGSRLS